MVCGLPWNVERDSFPNHSSPSWSRDKDKKMRLRRGGRTLPTPQGCAVKLEQRVTVELSDDRSEASRVKVENDAAVLVEVENDATVKICIKLRRMDEPVLDPSC